jgi:hypothetical protein
VQPALSNTVNDIDKHVRLVFTDSGPAYRSILEVEAALDLRRVCNLYYTQGFAEMLRAEILVYYARVKSFLPRLAMHACAHGNELGCLYPQHVRSWWPIVEDIFASPASKVGASEIHYNLYNRTLVLFCILMLPFLFGNRLIMEFGCVRQALRVRLLQHLADSDEYQSLSIDATMRCTLSVAGQTRPRQIHPGAAFAADDCKRRVLTVKGRTGAVLAMEAMSREDVQTYIDVFLATVPVDAFSTVHYIATDNPSNLLWESTRCFDNLTLFILTLLLLFSFDRNEYLALMSNMNKHNGN